MTKKTCEMWIAMMEDGDWVVATDESEALSKLAEDVGGYTARVVKVTVKMAPPIIPEVEVEVPEEAGTTSEIETEGRLKGGLLR
jgi:hypothetical protein